MEKIKENFIGDQSLAERSEGGKFNKKRKQGSLNAEPEMSLI